MRLNRNFLFKSFGILFSVILLINCGGTENENLIYPDAVVVNMVYEEYDEYIGQGRIVRTHMLAGSMQPGDDGWLGNPHPKGWCDICEEYHTLEESIREFRSDFYEKIDDDGAFRDQLLTLRGKRLGCYCKPEMCHGDVIKEWLDSQRN